MQQPYHEIYFQYLSYLKQSFAVNETPIIDMQATTGYEMVNKISGITSSAEMQLKEISWDEEMG